MTSKVQSEREINEGLGECVKGENSWLCALCAQVLLQTQRLSAGKGHVTIRRSVCCPCLNLESHFLLVLKARLHRCTTQGQSSTRCGQLSGQPPCVWQQLGVALNQLERFALYAGGRHRAHALTGKSTTACKDFGG
jgi:hypothetical protein